ncbi:bifunctional diaminohydroxyphosphoribosylaminopyrimidine deaminase/5-amino-6-(5-phosphoribosylamino)uracil reductase RibD [Neptunomonas phycophila]|uniref:bifunctional diaminohydroxyphosphoribosylaminopyrimidine deaminase/5-amino-6-(5-phosphoribosylamino)uracil reductase RibD n=1 Tax=Neptunomonas phycophila TaxID=1572645 RepID=UPI001BEB3BD7|nr:bifunctional diaminohydroxyphosphoribosylaminopyrimidine deaminase/5-amino-6-(5-phosphoribosylamino)uracil reductase RibD [Neptunomonas phycophila]MBT3144554.1 bifunctional diaminohydroxyphosphoribosylaminopyrimidine deaminase/5-amino-6-(5-phosphoribosylamino)uracil reductase RibD [Neptunomonas phycophila]
MNPVDSGFVTGGSSWSANDYQCMAEAIRLARCGVSSTDPNPRVGCLIVKNNTVVGRGYHIRAGEGHAEVNALREAGDKARGATAYVTLEPCSHFGRTPPCAQALIDAGLARVVSAMQDPNPSVAGRGLGMLKAAGISTEVGLLETQSRALNPGFIKRMETGKPFVRVKLAMSLDGRTAMSSGESQWITGAAARSDVQRFRACSSAIITGIESVLLDDPALTVRDVDLADENGFIRQPLRVVLDSHARLPRSASIIEQPGRTVQVVTQEEAMASVGLECEQLVMPASPQGIDLPALLNYLAKQEQCNEVLVETGARLAGAFIQAQLVDELVVYMAPTLLGSQARPLVDLPLSEMQEQQRLILTDVRHLGEDVRLTYHFNDRINQSTQAGL